MGISKTNRLLNYLNTPLLTIITLLAFIWLAGYSQQLQGYDTRQVSALNDLVEREGGDDWLSQLERSKAL